MAEQDTIKEFLVALGFKTDEEGQKKFSNAIGIATAKFTTLASLAEKAVESVVGNVKHFFSELEQFYFQAGETNSTVAGMKSLSLAAEHVGLSGEQALAALDGLATFIRHNPAGEGFLRGFGVQTRDANGQLLKTEELLLGVSRQLGKMPQYRANLYGQVLGLDEKTMMRMRSGEFEKHFRNAQKVLGGANLDHAAEQWRGLVEQFRTAGEELEVFGIRGASALLDKLGPVFNTLREDLKNSGLGDDLEELFGSLLDLGDKVATALGPTLQHGLQGAVALAGVLVNSVRIIADLLRGDLDKAGQDAERINAATGNAGQAALGLLNEVGRGTVAVGEAITGTQLAPAGGGPRSSTLNQRTIINVVGGDPVATASAVASQQDRVNAAGVRNLAKGTP